MMGSLCVSCVMAIAGLALWMRGIVLVAWSLGCLGMDLSVDVRQIDIVLPRLMVLMSVFCARVQLWDARDALLLRSVRNA